MNKKYLMFGVLGLFAMVIVTAAVIEHYGSIQQNINVEQAVTLSGDNCIDNVCTNDIGQVYSPDTRISGLYVLTNNDPENSRDVEIVRTCTPDCDGITTTYYTPSIENIIKGADRLVETQNNDGGWPWYASGGDSTTNTLGVTAQGLLDAYRLTGNVDYLNSAIDAYNYALVTVPTYDGTTETVKGVDSCPDFTFLVELSEITGEGKYAVLAKARYDTKKASVGGATQWAELIRDSRESRGYPALVSWDVNFCVDGALALDGYYPEDNYDLDANAMTEIIYEFMYEGTFDFNDTQAEYWLSHTGAIEAFITTELHTDKVESLVTSLISSQYSSGCFSGTQVTAYAIMALLNVNEKEVVLDASDCLINSQDIATGIWLDSGIEYTEVSSEAIQTMLFKDQLTSPVTISADSILGFIIINELNTAGTEIYTIITKAIPVV